MNPNKEDIDNNSSDIKDVILSDISTLKEQVSYTSNQLTFLKESEKDYWNKLLDSNIRAGTMACMWCIKTQIIKKISLAFNHWKILTALPRSYHSSIYGATQLNKEENNEIDALVAAMKLLKKSKDSNHIHKNSTLIDSLNFDEAKDSTFTNLISNYHNEQKRNILLALSKNIISKLNKSPVTSHKTRQSPSHIVSNVSAHDTKNDTTVIHRTSLSLFNRTNRKHSNHQSPPINSSNSSAIPSSSQRSNKPTNYLQQQNSSGSKPPNSMDRNISNASSTRYHEVAGNYIDEDTVGRFLSDLQEPPPPSSSNDLSSMTPYKQTTHRNQADNAYSDTNDAYSDTIHDKIQHQYTVLPPPPVWSDYHPFTFNNNHDNHSHNDITTSSSEYNRNNALNKNIPRYLQATRSTIKKTNQSPNVFKVNNKPKSATPLSKPIISTSNIRSSNSYSTKIYHNNVLIGRNDSHHHKYQSNNTSHHESNNTGHKTMNYNDQHIESKHSTTTSGDILFDMNQSKDILFIPKDCNQTNNKIDIDKRTYYNQQVAAENVTIQSINPNQSHGSIYNYMNVSDNITNKNNVINKVLNDKVSPTPSNNNMNNKPNKHIEKAQLKLFYGDLSEVGSTKHQWTRNLRK